MIRLLLTFLLLPSIAFAAPSISNVSGTVEEGESITITGSSFGTKSTAAPLLWDDFESGSDGAALTTDDNWVKNPSADGNGGEYDNARSYSGSLSAHNQVTSSSGAFNTCNSFFTASDEVYHSYLIRWEENGADSAIMKYNRINASPHRYTGPGTFAFSSGDPSTGGSGAYWYAEAGGTPLYIFQIYRTIGDDTWHRIEMYDYLSTPAGTANGINWFAINNNNITNRTGEVNRASGYSFQQDNIILGLMCANLSTGTVDFWIDDVYVDNTRSRVELGNNSVFANCTHREIQIPTAWSATSISVTVNQGTFDDEDTAYLFVIDSNGDPSSGEEVTIGSAGGGNASTGSFSVGSGNVDLSVGSGNLTLN
jgi:hypothetical protein